MKEILMCSPTAFDVVYEINPWMSLANRPDKAKAMSQWQTLYDFYIENGVKVNLIEQDENLPDMVFTANAGIIDENVFISGKFISEPRRPEEKIFQKWFQDNGYQVKLLKHFQGGEGDALLYRDKLYCGYGFRSDFESHFELSLLIGKEVVSFKIVDPRFYDFDLTFCPLGDKAVLCYPDAYDNESQNKINSIPNLIRLTSQQVVKHLCNSVYINGKLLMSQPDRELEKELIKLDIEPVIIDVSEFNKAGGGIKCLTLKMA